MSSDRNGQKPESMAAGPPSGVSSRGSARAPSAWGAVRDGLAAVHNLGALLRSASVQTRTIIDLMPELRSGAGVLHVAFERALAGDPATMRVGEHGGKTVAVLDALLDAITANPADRSGHADRAADLADELEATADLLALLDRAAAPVATEVGLDLVAREAGRMSGTARGREMIIQFDESNPDCIVTTDPYVLGPLVSLLVARVQVAGVHSIVLRARSTPDAHFVVEAARFEDGVLPAVSLRVTRWIPPSEDAMLRIAEQIGATLEIEARRGSIRLAPPT